MSAPEANARVSRAPWKRNYRLRLDAPAVAGLAAAGARLAAGERFRLFLHPASGAVALQFDGDGPFRAEGSPDGALTVLLPKALVPGALACGGYRAAPHPAFAAVLEPCPGGDGDRGGEEGAPPPARRTERRSPEATFAGFSRERGAVLFRQGAIRFWAEKGLRVTPGQAVRIYLDTTTGALAFRLEPGGPFRFGRCRTWGAEKPILSSTALWRLIGREIAYAFAALPGFDFALVPWPAGSPVPDGLALPPDAAARLAEVDPWAQGRLASPHHAGIALGPAHCAVLTFTAAGMRWLRDRGLAPAAGGRVRLYHDPDNDEVALRFDPQGTFRLRAAQRGRSLAVHSVDLGRLVGTPRNYRMELRAGYDVVLVEDGDEAAQVGRKRHE